jgi:adenosine deaminase
MVKEPCPAPLVAASELSGTLTQAQQDLAYDHLINAISMRNFVPPTGYTGHDQFFYTFARCGVIDKRHTGDWIDDVTRRAASQNQQYLELLETPSFGHAARTAHELGWNPDLAQMRQALLDHGLRDEVATDREEIRTAIELRNRLQHCGTPEALPACQVQVRFVYQVRRAFSPQQVFAQTLLAWKP